MATGTTWYKTKLAIMQRQRKKDPAQMVAHVNARGEIAKGKAEARRLAHDTMKSFDGVVTLGEVGPMVRSAGKGRRMYDTRTYGNFARGRRALTAHEYYSLWSTESVLIKRT